MTTTLTRLTIKPVHACVHHCPYCASRRQLLRNSAGSDLSVGEWFRVLGEADQLGTDYLDISGGEPTLYKKLTSVIWEAKHRGWFVSLNTTGWLLPHVLPELQRYCLDQVVLSLLSLNPALHDRLRQTPGSWQWVSGALNALRGSGVRLILHFIIGRDNFRELPELIDFAFAHNANGLALVYPENDGAERHLLMSKEEIGEFRARVLPECLRRYSRHRPQDDGSHTNLARLFGAHGAGCDFSQGVYWPDAASVRGACSQAETFALIYPNGDVLACNGVEYTHGPLMGNVRRSSVKEIWHGEAYQAFRRDRMAFCRLCPIKRHTGLAIRTTDNPPYAAPVIRRVPDSLPLVHPDQPDGEGTLDKSE